LKEALPQLQFRNFLKECCSTTAILQSHFFFRSPQLESFTSAIFGKKSLATVPLRQVLDTRETDRPKNIFG
jgi:hypothetical protein